MTKLFFGAAAALLLCSTAASASVVSVTVTSGQTSLFAPTTYDFSSNPFSSVTPGGNVLFTGSNSGQNAAPFGDVTQYASIGTSSTPQTAVLTVSSPANYLGLYWGSIDTYNTIVLTYTDNTTATVDLNIDAQLSPSNGDQGVDGSKYVNIFSDRNIASISFTSSQKAFEFDNVSIAAVPEASTWAMMVLGFLGLGFLGYRKSARSAGASFRVA